MTREETTEQKQDARAANLPAQPMLACDRTGQRVNANLVGRLKERLRIQPFVKQEFRRASCVADEIVLRATRLHDRVAYFRVEGGFGRIGKRGDVQAATDPNPAFHSGTPAIAGELE